MTDDVGQREYLIGGAGGGTHYHQHHQQPQHEHKASRCVPPRAHGRQEGAVHLSRASHRREAAGQPACSLEPSVEFACNRGFFLRSFSLFFSDLHQGWPHGGSRLAWFEFILGNTFSLGIEKPPSSRDCSIRHLLQSPVF